MLAFACILFMAVLRLGIAAYLHCSGCSDEGLFLAAKECVVSTVGILELNKEVSKVFSGSSRAEDLRASFYTAPNGGPLDNVRRALSSSSSWHRAEFDGHSALVLRFGCHYNYAWLVVVDPAYRIRYRDYRIKVIEGNIGVCFDSGFLLRY